MKKTIVYFSIPLLLLITPFILWNIQQKETLQVTIIDYTVPDETYREHHSLTWLLNYFRFENNEGESYDPKVDYYGFVSDETKEEYTIRSLPENLNDPNLIYIADTYGVNEDELAWTEADSSEGPPTRLYGGMDQQEWTAVKEKVVTSFTDLVVEFNSFASPTEEAVRRDVMEFLNVEWQGWIGRQFPSLDKENGEVPDWVIKRYEKDEDWAFTGAGFVLLNELTDEIVVLSKEDLTDTALRFMLTEEGQELFGFEQSSAYPYWFDIIQTQSEEQILGNYELKLTKQGESKLNEKDLPSTFPAIVHHTVNQSNVFYFAGDFADTAKVPGFYQYTGLAKIFSFISLESISPERSFFWKTYTPIMDKVFSLAKEKEETIANNKPVVSQAVEDSISYPARINEQAYEVYQDGEWVPITLKGVNLGMGRPGAFPGEAAISKDEYTRWFKQIGEMNANVLRVYTLHPPGFYEALYEYNQAADEPLYLLHGVWIDEEPLEETLDASDEEITSVFQEEMKKIVDVIHGNAVIAPQQGHASGAYHKNISPYVIGWVLGIEWYPFMVDQMVQDYPDPKQYNGSYVYTENANAMEAWMAQQLDFITSYEVDEYSSMRPLSFTNWVTTDNIDQPAEPSDQEDLATVDPNHIHTKDDAEHVGMFASYHVYPYYPDFLTIEEKYTEFIDHRGEKNNYAGYLHDLNESHEMPILIAEFGIPASRGMTHKNPFGWNQGFIEESEQGEILTHLYEDILHEEMLGGLIFTWQDEWFKRTWNTMDYDNPDRRPFWSNAQTNEQQFGLLSFDRLKVKLNGEDDWEEGTVLYEKDNGELQELSVDHDERYLYIKAQMEDTSEDFWKVNDLNLYFSVREDAGVMINDVSAEPMPSDFRLTIEDQSSAKLEIAGDYDSFFYDYAHRLEMIEATPDELENKDKEFHPIRLALSKELIRPDTGEVYPFDAYETGILRFGIGDPAHPDYDSLSDYYFTEVNGIVEIRIPWMLLNAKDPSKKEFFGDLWKDGIDASLTIEGIDVAAAIEQNGRVTDAFDTASLQRYTWEDWDLPRSQERLKPSYKIIQEFFSSLE
ncbi:hypothetical protein [Jeotgalibacillus proteolyticus]|uniref:hypothetical protein n=1 Tax=Jeotgalibacillus proteolyticus TaxID=2082395 RepID=UPI001FD63D20|nr:hypothetical protein [Jeotgalibacillus proteolyticus]